MKTKLISAFPGTGKSHYTKYIKGWNQKVLDSDSSTFDKSHFPENYIQHIKDEIGFTDIIFISSHEEVRTALVENNIEFTLVYPNINLKEDYIQRYKKRGNLEAFVVLLENHWEEWIKDCKNQSGCNHIELKKGEYIADIIHTL